MKQLNKETAEKLHAEIPSNIVTKFDLDINIDYRYGIFRFNNPKLENIYLFIRNKEGDKYVIKYSYPELKFSRIYINEEVPNWGILDRRYDKDLNIDAEYEWYVDGTHNPNKYLAVKIKEYDKDGNPVTVHKPYVLGDGIAPISIDPIKPYIETIHETYKFFYKENAPFNRFIVWEECEGCEKNL